MEVQINNNIHQFRSESELSNESKGGYLDGFIQVPKAISNQEVDRIEIELVDKNYGPHPNLFFISPYSKNKEDKNTSGSNKENFSMVKEDSKVLIKIDENERKWDSWIQKTRCICIFFIASLQIAPIT